MVSENLREDLENLGELTESCVFTEPKVHVLGVQNGDVLNYQLYVEFTTPVSRDDIGYPPYDLPFIPCGADAPYHGTG
ncbi:hypothetical protein OH492_12385 [Vibrio chagasii]|nr:hypothetical protein [Vibrio chagasii]